MDVLFKRYFWTINLSVIAVCAIFAGRAASHMAEGAFLSEVPKAAKSVRRTVTAAPQKVHGKDPEEIIKRNIFCSSCGPIAPPPGAGGPNQTPGDDHNPQKSSLSLELVSTMVCPSDDAWSMAVIRDSSTKEKDPVMYARESLIKPYNAKVVKVVSKRVYIRNNERLEYLEIEGSEPPKLASNVSEVNPTPGGAFDPNMGDIDKGVSCSGNNCTVERGLVEKMLSNTSMLASSARFVPSMKDGRPNGWKLYAIRPNSIFAKIGLQNADTVKAINGLEMTSPDKALEVYTKVRNASHLSVAIERHGENVTLDYTLR